MPFVKNEGIRIHYEVEGAGPPLVMVHGGIGSLEDWREYGYTTRLKDDYRLILVDYRGHGKSDKPHTPEQYALEMLASDIITVLDAQGIDTCHYLGFSGGAWIGFGVAQHWPRRLRSLIILDHHPYPIDMTGFQERVKVMESWVPEMSNISTGHKGRLLANDTEAMVAASKARHQVDASAVLDCIDYPCMVVAAGGETAFDTVKRCADTIKTAELVSLNGFKHFDVVLRGEEVLPYIVDSLSRVS